MIRMAMIEPVVNMSEFKKDYQNGMSAHNLQAKYVLTPRQFRWLRNKIYINKRNPNRKRTGVNKRKPKQYGVNEPYISLQEGKWLVRKGRTYYGQYLTFEQAKYIKTRLIEENWDKNKLDKIRDEINIKPLRSYNYDK